MGWLRTPDRGWCFACCLSLHSSADACRVAARDELRKGAHCIKIMASGGVASPTDRCTVLLLCTVDSIVALVSQ